MLRGCTLVPAFRSSRAPCPGWAIDMVECHRIRLQINSDSSSVSTSSAMLCTSRSPFLRFKVCVHRKSLPGSGRTRRCQSLRQNTSGSCLRDLARSRPFRFVNQRRPAASQAGSARESLAFSRGKDDCSVSFCCKSARSCAVTGTGIRSRSHTSGYPAQAASVRCPG